MRWRWSGLAARRPLVRLRLRTVLVLVCLFVLVPPVAGLQVLRIYESVLLRQTEAGLMDQAAFVAAAFRAGLAAATGSGADGASPPAARGAVLDFADATVFPPFPAPRAGGHADAAARRVGANVQKVLRDALADTSAAGRVVDAGGVVVATTAADLGLSLLHVEEVRQALAGAPGSRLRSVPGSGESASLLGRIAVQVFVTKPVAVGERVVGAVVMSRRPPGIVETLYRKRALLLQAAAVVFAVVVAIALVAARALVLPIKRLSRGAGRLSRGETDRFERGRPYRVLEIAELADSVESMAARLQQRSAYVRSLARHVSHEFKTPITGMRGAVELLRDHLEDMSESRRRRFLDNLAADIERLDRLTLRLLELANIDMADASDEVTDVLAVARGRGHALAHVAAGEARARIAATSMAAVLDNLVENAGQHGATLVDIHAARVGDTVEMHVADDGEGISPGNRDRVFEPFFTTRRDRGGTGLGLAISRSLVQQAGGGIELVPGERGAAFRIVLPAAGDRAG